MLFDDLGGDKKAFLLTLDTLQKIDGEIERRRLKPSPDHFDESEQPGGGIRFSLRPEIAQTLRGARWSVSPVFDSGYTGDVEIRGGQLIVPTANNLEDIWDFGALYFPKTVAAAPDQYVFMEIDWELQETTVANQTGDDADHERTEWRWIVTAVDFFVSDDEEIIPSAYSWWPRPATCTTHVLLADVLQDPTTLEVSTRMRWRSHIRETQPTLLERTLLPQIAFPANSSEGPDEDHPVVFIERFPRNSQVVADLDAAFLNYDCQSLTQQLKVLSERPITMLDINGSVYEFSRLEVQDGPTLNVNRYAICPGTA